MAGMLSFAGFGVAIFALISAIVSVALDYWVYASVSQSSFTVKLYAGLWKVCGGGGPGGASACSSFSATTDEMKAVRAMLILAVLLDSAAIVCFGLKLFLMKEQKMLGKAACGMLTVAGLFLVVGFAVFVAKVFDFYKATFQLSLSGSDPSLHAGFALCIIAWLASWAAAGLIGVSTKNEE